MKVDEFEAAFVTSFPHSNTRSSIFVGYAAHRAQLADILDTFEQFIDGSFTTNKNDPNDVDLLVLADGDLVDALPVNMQMRLQELVAGKSTQTKFMCDAYFCPTYPEGHPNHAHARPQRKYWMGEFGFDRSDVPKGIVNMKHQK